MRTVRTSRDVSNDELRNLRAAHPDPKIVEACELALGERAPDYSHGASELAREGARLAARQICARAINAGCPVCGGDIIGDPHDPRGLCGGATYHATLPPRPPLEPATLTDVDIEQLRRGTFDPIVYSATLIAPSDRAHVVEHERYQRARQICCDAIAAALAAQEVKS